MTEQPKRKPNLAAQAIGTVLGIGLLIAVALLKPEWFPARIRVPMIVAAVLGAVFIVVMVVAAKRKQP